MTKSTSKLCIEVFTTVNLIGANNNLAFLIPVQFYASKKADNSLVNDFCGDGKTSQTLLKEIPYLKSLLISIIPELEILFKTYTIQLKSKIDDSYVVDITDTRSAQLGIALGLCILFRKSLGLSTNENFASTGSLDDLGFIKKVNDMDIKKRVAENSIHIDSSSCNHLFDGLHKIGGLELR